MTASNTRRYVVFALLGAVALVLKSRYGGPFGPTVHAYGGNIVGSFAVFFVVSIGIAGTGLGRRAAAALALLVVELFEATNGFGFMTNTYDPGDYVANAIGVGIAVAVDLAVARAPRIGRT